MVCIIEGILYYEMDYFEDGMFRVLGVVLELVWDFEVVVVVKVLVISLIMMEMVYYRFKDDDLCFLLFFEV